MTVQRTKRAVARNSWSAHDRGDSGLVTFEACKNALANQVTLSHGDESQRLFVYTDASKTVWSGIVTLVPMLDLAKPHKEQRHDPLAFLSSRLNRIQLGWSILEKEAYAALVTLDRMHWVAATPAGFDLYTDHNNLIVIFDGGGGLPNLEDPFEPLVNVYEAVPKMLLRLLERKTTAPDLAQKARTSLAL